MEIRFSVDEYEYQKIEELRKILKFSSKKKLLLFLVSQEYRHQMDKKSEKK